MQTMRALRLWQEGLGVVGGRWQQVLLLLLLLLLLLPAALRTCLCSRPPPRQPAPALR
jgi:hypothetical protein